MFIRRAFSAVLVLSFLTVIPMDSVLANQDGVNAYCQTVFGISSGNSERRESIDLAYSTHMGGFLRPDTLRVIRLESSKLLEPIMNEGEKAAFVGRLQQPQGGEVVLAFAKGREEIAELNAEITDALAAAEHASLDRFVEAEHVFRRDNGVMAIFDPMLWSPAPVEIHERPGPKALKKVLNLGSLVGMGFFAALGVWENGHYGTTSFGPTLGFAGAWFALLATRSLGRISSDRLTVGSAEPIHLRESGDAVAFVLPYLDKGGSRREQVLVVGLAPDEMIETRWPRLAQWSKEPYMAIVDRAAP